MAEVAAMDDRIAIVGLACRFPGARGEAEFWTNIRSGNRSIRRWSRAELLAAGVDPELAERPDYVAAQGSVDGIFDFDATFFGLSAREAELTDPQHRFFLECAWEALENAAYDPARFAGRIGVFGGCSSSGYVLRLIEGGLVRPEELMSLTIGNAPDFLTTRVGYKLGLRGPCITVQTACSTSLVAVHLAALHLMAGDCDIALAGGVSLRPMDACGYVFVEGGILSPDGHCRAFDAGAQGTVEGGGVGVVVLRRLEEALKDRDHIRAVLCGSAVNNDGNRKVGFTAPSVPGQAEVIATAQAMAGVAGTSIGYVEAHGTGTPLGDPVEIAALNEAFGGGEKRRFCAIGSVKSNIGHADTAAGIAGLIKAVLAVENAELPPAVDYRSPNPNIDFNASAVYVNEQLRPWTGGAPRRAGVSSFGIGGTNAHVIIEQAPPRTDRSTTRWPVILTASAPTAARAEQVWNRLNEHAATVASSELPDVAYTLHVGRAAFEYRVAAVVRDADDVTGQLRAPVRGSASDSNAGVVFAFPGQGEQRWELARELMASEPGFRRSLEECEDAFVRHGISPLSFLAASTRQSAENQTRLVQPATFCLGYSLARLWIGFGVTPVCLLGHSAGELAAACLAGVMSFEEAVAAVAARAEEMQRAPAGAMLGVALSEADAARWLVDGVHLAVVNGPQRCVLAGTPAVIEATRRRLTQTGIANALLPAAHAFHTPDLADASASFERFMVGRALQPPRIVFVSSCTGDWLTDQEATNPAYWARQMCQTVRFDLALQRVYGLGRVVVLEMGAESPLTALVRSDPRRPPEVRAFASFAQSRKRSSARQAIARTLASLWVHGAPLDWHAVHDGELLRRVPAPTHPFERTRHVPVTIRAAASANRLPSPAGATASAAPSVEPARGDQAAAEQTLESIWCAVLGLDRIGWTQDLFELGADSLVFTQVLSRLRAAGHVAIQLKELYQASTIAQAADLLRASLVRARPRGTTDEAHHPGAGELAEPVASEAVRGAAHPLSFSQQRIWLVEQLFPGTSTHHLFHCARLGGEVDEASLQRALDDLVCRRDAFRTAFRVVREEPAQVVDAGARIALETFDPAGRESQASFEEALAQAAESSARPFDLTVAPLARVQLIRVSRHSSLLALTIHHLVADGWSLGILIRELIALYRSHVAGRAPTLGPSADALPFARWQRAAERRQEFSEQLGYWERQLAGIKRLELPTDHPRSGTPTRRGACSRFELCTELVVAADRMAVEHRCTPFVVYLAAFALVLRQYANTTDIAIGTPVANRNQLQWEGIVGCLVNNLVLRLDLSGDPEVSQLLDRVRAVVADAQSNQDCPFELVVDRLQPEREIGRTPLFQVMFALQEAQEDTIDLPDAGLKVTFVETTRNTSQFDLTFAIHRRPGEARLEIEYSTDLFGETTVRCLAEAYCEVLARAAAAPSRRIGSLWRFEDVWSRMVPVPCRVAGAAVVTPFVADMVFTDVDGRASAPAVIDGSGAEVSYATLNRVSTSIARRLIAMGVEPETPVGVFMRRGATAVAALLAVLRSGGIYLPLDPAMPRARIEHILADACPKVVLTCGSDAADLPPTSAEMQVIDASAAWSDDYDGVELVTPLRPESGAYLIYTSGSTGDPKGVVVSHRALAAYSGTIAGRYGLGASDRCLQFASLSFDVSLEEILPPLVAGASVAVFSSAIADLAGMLEYVRARSATVLNLPSGIWHLWVSALEAGTADVPSSVRLVIAGSETASSAALESWTSSAGRAVRWLNAYGASETTITSTLYEHSATPLEMKSVVPVGQALSGVCTYVLDERLARVPPNAPGELYVAGFGVARGYWRRPCETAERFLPDPFAAEAGVRMYRTGDLARYDWEGNLELLGRADDQVKIRGVRVELGDVEGALARHPAVAAAAAAFDRDSLRLHAAVVAKAGMVVSERDLRSFMLERLAPQFVPARIVGVERLPMMPSGKLDRNALGRMLVQLEEPAPVDGEDRPVTEVQATLVRIWQGVLARQRVSIRDGFFDLGGDSLLVVRVCLEARRAGIELTPQQVFIHQNIEALASVAGRTTSEGGAAYVGALPLTPCQAGFFEDLGFDAAHYNHALLLRVQKPMPHAALRAAVAGLAAKYDVLRMRFARDGERMVQVYSEDPADLGLSIVTLTTVPEEVAKQIVERTCEALQRSLDLARGPLARIAYFDTAQPETGRLLIVMHRLLADYLAWEAILTDLVAVYRDAANGRPPQRDRSGVSHAEWSRYVNSTERCQQAREQRVDLLDGLAGPFRALPIARPERPNVEGTCVSHLTSLSHEQTRHVRDLLSACPEIDMAALMLGALSAALGRWLGEGSMLIDYGLHGRSAFEEIDASAVVGRLAGECPIRLELRANPQPGDLREIARTLGKLARLGTSFGILKHVLADPEIRRLPRAFISFDYLGEQTAVRTEEFSVAPEHVGALRGPNLPRQHHLEVVTGIRDGQLDIRWRFSESLAASASMPAVADAMGRALVELALLAQRADQRSHPIGIRNVL